MSNQSLIQDSSDNMVLQLQQMTADPLPLAPGEWQGETSHLLVLPQSSRSYQPLKAFNPYIVTEDELNGKKKKELQEFIRNNNIPIGKGFISIHAKKTELITHIITHLPSLGI